MFLFDWVNLTDNIPVDKGGARWSSNGTLVNPSVVHIKQVHQVSISHFINNWICRQIIPVQFVEEIINYLLFSDRCSNSGFFYTEHDSHCSSNETIVLCFWACWIVNGMHFEIHSFTINCVLWPSVEMELLSSKFSWTFEYFFTSWSRQSTIEQNFLIWLSVCPNLRCMAIPDNTIASLVFVTFDKIILRWIKNGVCIPTIIAWPDQVNWWLEWLITVRTSLSPISTLSQIIPFSCFSTSEE